MNILIYSYTFWPNIGGIEDVGETLAVGLVELGHKVTVVTSAPCRTAEKDIKYRLVRNPSWIELIRLVLRNDLVHTNGSSVRLLPLALLLRKPFTWTHHGYQLQCIDGAGWIAGKPAPMNPWASVVHHFRMLGAISALSGAAKLLLRRLAAQTVHANIASSEHIAFRQPLPRQRVIYNPWSADAYMSCGQKEPYADASAEFATFIFVGRLISEKGVDDLLHAFARLSDHEQLESGKRIATLMIVGDGPEKRFLQELACKLNIEAQVHWKGFQCHRDLRKELAGARICIMPSAWEEPSALTAMIAMACGKPLIVSERGWLTECAADACISFPNGNREALADAMIKLMCDQSLQRRLVEKALKRVKDFDPKHQVESYSNLFQELSNSSKVSAASSLLTFDRHRGQVS